MSFIEAEYRERDKPFAMTALQSHDYYEIYCLIEGERQVFFENCMFTLGGGAICVIPPFKMHKMEGGPYKRVNLYISKDVFDQAENGFLLECADKTAFTLDTEHSTLFFSLAEAFSKKQRSDATIGERSLSALARVLVSILRLSKISPIDTATVGRVAKRDDLLILKIMEYINENPDRQTTLDEISKRFFISKNSLGTSQTNLVTCIDNGV